MHSPHPPAEGSMADTLRAECDKGHREGYERVTEAQERGQFKSRCQRVG